MFTASETASIVDGSFSLDFARMNLLNENQSVYEGSGSVYIDEEGMLKAKICHVFGKDESAFDNWGKAAQRALSSIPGKILPSSSYYFFEGVDVSGRTWTANNISSVSAPLSFPSCAQIVTATLPSIVCDKSENFNNYSELKELTFAQFIVRGDYEFPWNTWVSKEHSKSLSRSEFVFEEEKCFIEIFDKKYIKIGVSVRDEHQHKILLEALSIACGMLLQPTVQIVSTNKKTVCCIYSRRKQFTAPKMLTPFEMSSPEKVSNLEAFVGSYCQTHKKEHAAFFSSWERILESKRSQLLDNTCLVLCVAIETVLKSDFNYLFEDENFKREISEAIDIIKNLDSISERLKNRIEGVLRSPSSPSAILKKMESENRITHNMYESWRSLRNASAHAKHFSDFNMDKLQLTIDKMHTCVSLFYQLLFDHINYSGEYIDYSSDGWPRKSMIRKLCNSS